MMAQHIAHCNIAIRMRILRWRSSGCVPKVTAMTNPDLAKAKALLEPDTIACVCKAPFNVRGWKILERWAANSPAALQDLERRGLVAFLNRLRDQQQLESRALEAQLGFLRHLAAREVLALA